MFWVKLALIQAVLDLWREIDRCVSHGPAEMTNKLMASYHLTVAPLSLAVVQPAEPPLVVGPRVSVGE